MEQLTIFKIGGNVIDDPEARNEFLQGFSNWKGLKILVHGGGKIASATLTQMGIQPIMVHGRRVTDQESLRVVVMVYAGWVNKGIVADLNALGLNALGLTGADADTIRAQKRPSVPVDYGFAGDVEKVNGSRIGELLRVGFTPVFCAITHNGKGQLLNTNADTIAAELAKNLSADFSVRLFLCLEKAGVLRNAEDDYSLIPDLDLQSFQQLKQEKAIFSGMIPKIDNGFEALQSGVEEVRICSHRIAFDPTSNGTLLCL